MNKVLLALDCSPHARRAAEYLADIAPRIPGCEVTLLMVTTGIPLFEREVDDVAALPATPPEVHGDVDHQQELDLIRGCFAEVRQLLQTAGLPPERLHTRLKPLGRGVALDILDEAAAGSFDTVVVGRRGLSKIGEFLGGSVSNDLLHKASGVTLWIVE